MSAPRRIVVLNFTRMGDLIQSGPLLRSLRRGCPESHLTLVVMRNFAAAASRLPMADRVIPFEADRVVANLDGRQGDLGAAYQQLQDLVSDAALRDADLLVNLSHTPLSATLAALLRPRAVWGLHRQADGQLHCASAWITYLLSLMQERTYNPFNLAEIYLRLNPARGTRHRLEFTVTDADAREAEALLRQAGLEGNRPFVVLQAGASSPSRMWPAASFAALAQMLHRRGFRSVLVGSAEEASLAARITQASNGAAVSLAAQTSVGTLAAVVRGAHRVVSNDTGTIHLAAAVGTGTVGLYLGPASAKDTAPYAGGHWVLEADLSCAPCSYQEQCASLRCHHQIAPQDVFALTLAAPEDAARVAGSFGGVRAYRTAVADDGSFYLNRMNAARHDVDEDTLARYRQFWLRLFRQPAETEFPASPLGSSGCAEALRLAQTAARAIQLLAAASTERELETAMARQEEWQGALHSLLASQPALRPLVRYTLVQLSLVRKCQLTEYVADLAAAVETLARGAALLEDQSAVRVGERHYAAV